MRVIVAHPARGLLDSASGEKEAVMPNDNKKGIKQGDKSFEQDRSNQGGSDKSSSKQQNKQDRSDYSGSKQGSSR
jgi:hypothetical protein